jgi:hypothetical protein
VTVILAALITLLPQGAPMGAVPAARLPLRARDLDGLARQIPDPGARATVLLFIAHTCPNANRYLPEIERLHAAYAARGARILTVYAEPGLGAEEARRHRKEFGISAPALVEPWRELVAATGATVTPEAVVLAPDGRLLYRGRIDDRFAELGRKRARPRSRDLEDALRAVLSGLPVPVPRTEAVGCFIPKP